MHCTGEHCERKNECARYYMIAPNDGQIHTLESLYFFGSGSIRNDGTVENHYCCSPLGNWGMFIPIKKTNADHIRSLSDEGLAEFANFCPTIDDECPIPKGGCRECVLNWLKQPYKEEV